MSIYLFLLDLHMNFKFIPSLLIQTCFTCMNLAFTLSHIFSSLPSFFFFQILFICELKTTWSPIFTSSPFLNKQNTIIFSKLLWNRKYMFSILKINEWEIEEEFECKSRGEKQTHFKIFFCWTPFQSKVKQLFIEVSRSHH